MAVGATGGSGLVRGRNPLCRQGQPTGGGNSFCWLLVRPGDSWGHLFFFVAALSACSQGCVFPGDELGLAADGRREACTTTRFTRPRRGQIVTKNSLVSTQDSIQPSVWAYK